MNLVKPNNLRITTGFSDVFFWSVADEHSRVKIHTDIYNDKKRFHLSDWFIHYGDEQWRYVLNDVGQILTDEIKTIGSVQHIKRSLENAGANVDVVFLDIKCAIFYVHSQKSSRIARFFVCDLNQKQFNVSFYEASQFSSSSFLFNDTHKDLYYLGKWVVDGYLRRKISVLED